MNKLNHKIILLVIFSALVVVTFLIISRINYNADNRNKADTNIVACHKERLMWMWNTRRKDEWQPVKTSGANVVSVEGNEGRSNPDVMNADLNYLSSINMKGIVHLDTLFNAQNIFDTNYQNKIRNYINSIKNNPGIYGYFLADEPDIGRRLTADKVKKLNEIIKSVDATHPTILNLFTVFSGEISEYVGTADIEGTDYYAWAGDPHGTYRTSVFEFKVVINKFTDYYENLPVNNTKQYFVFIQAYKWTPGNIEPPTNINYIPTYDDLNGLLNYMKDRSQKFKGHSYYYWSSETIPETTLDTVPELLNSVSQISETWKNDYGAYPVEIGCEPPAVIQNNTSSPVIVTPSLSCNISTSCTVQYFTKDNGLNCFKVLNLDDCKTYNGSSDLRYIIYGGNENTNLDKSSQTCQNNQNLLSSGSIVEGREYCANTVGTNYKYNQVDFNFKVKYSIDQQSKITIDKCNSGGIEPGGVCSMSATQCNRYDLNSDGKIDILGDFGIFLNLLVKDDKRADFNSDNTINVKDFLLFKSALYKYIDTKSCDL